MNAVRMANRLLHIAHWIESGDRLGMGDSIVSDKMIQKKNRVDFVFN